MYLDPTGVMLLLRVTARISGVLLAGSFASLALSRLWPSTLTQWMAANRHRVTLLFVLSHTVHLAGVVTLAALMPERYISKQGLAVFIPGGLAYALIYYLAWMAFRRRRSPDLPDTKMQTFGMYAIWGIFTLSFTSRLRTSVWIYLPLASVMWVALAARVWAKLALRPPDKSAWQTVDLKKTLPSGLLSSRSAGGLSAGASLVARASVVTRAIAAQRSAGFSALKTPAGLSFQIQTWTSH